MLPKRGKIGVMPRVAGGLRLVGRAVMFGVENRGLFPERAFDFQRDDLRAEIGEGIGSELSDQGRDGMFAGRTLIRQ